MEYCVLGKDNITGKSAEQVITLMLHEYSRQLYGFTRAEFDSIVEYDVLIIMPIAMRHKDIKYSKGLGNSG